MVEGKYSALNICKDYFKQLKTTLAFMNKLLKGWGGNEGGLWRRTARLSLLLASIWVIHVD